MAINTATMEESEVTFLFERVGREVYRDDYGYGRKTIRQLPWCFIRFGGDGEERKYLQPLSPRSIIGGVYNTDLRDLTFGDTTTSVAPTFGRAFVEFASFAPFPYEQFRAVQSNGAGDDDNIGGPIAIHFFGGI